MQRTWHLASASLALLTALSGCGGGGDGSTPAPAPAPSPAPGGGGGGGALAAATVTGKLVAPDGSTPLANALVYIEGSAIAGARPGPLKASLAVPDPSVCGTPPTAGWSYTCSAADGSFTWDGQIPANAKLVAVKGAFRIEQTLTASGGSVALGNLSVPTGTSAGATKMAVVTGLFDSVQTILAKLGFGTVDPATGQLQLGTEKFDLYSGDGALDPAKYKAFDALFQTDAATGKAAIFNYAIVFLNCGLSTASATDPARLQLLREYVGQGGRLYVSDQAYDYVEQAFPGYVDFEGSAGTAAANPEAPGDADVGTDGITVDATLDATLRGWLGNVTCGAGASCLTGGTTAHVEGFLSGWAVMVGQHASPPSPVRVWVRGPVTFDGQATPVDRPLTASFGVGSGRVTFTSYHNEVFGPPSAGFVPVERILQFLVFEL